MKDMVWNRPHMTNIMFDGLLDDVAQEVEERIQACDLGDMGESSSIVGLIFVATYDEESHVRGWSRAVSHAPTADTEKTRVACSTVGRMVVRAGQLPVAAFWLKRGNMSVTHPSGEKEVHSGFLVLGMTDDERVNGAFVATRANDTQPSCELFVERRTFYAVDMGYGQDMDTKILGYLFEAAREAYLELHSGDRYDEQSET
jgi:hypothetical protein